MNSDRASTTVLAMPVRSWGRPEVTVSPSGGATVSCETAALVLAASAPMFPRARPAAGGSTDHEHCLAARPPANAAGFTTAGPSMMVMLAALSPA